MSIKKYFEVAENIQSLSNKSAQEIASQVESAGYHEQDLIQEERFISRVDFSKPQNFARWGSAEEYYNEALKRIYEGYPYDGSLRERSEWHNESIDIDLYVFENRYPRTTGYVILSADGWGTGNLVDGYGSPATPEYIYVKGGPNPHQVKETPYTIQFTGSNYYEPSKNRGSNLSLNLASNGASLEFWLKKSAYLEESPREVIFDLWNGENSSSADYARFRLELTGNLTDGSTPFLLTAMSGTTGFYRQNISSTSITSASVGNDTWQHYAVTLKSASAGVTTRFYVNGALDKESTLGSTGINDVDSTALRAYAGALVTAVSGTTTPSSTKAADGKLSASLDEFRYWKTQRSSEEIGRFWFTQVGGGVNTDPVPFTTTEESSNVNLGVYFKFNEGITGRAATDSVVLDYSGRWSNGAWTGYTSNSRNTGSAIISSSAAVREFEDPIIYSFHPRVELLSTQLQLSGSTYDVNNNASLFKTIPSWISEEDEEGSGDVKKLTQILSSYFDSLHLKIESLNKLKDIRYLSGSAEKPLPFAEKLLSNYGLVAPDLFLDADILEKLLDRSEDKVYEKSLHDIKNIIYQNIYNNLNYIYKSKGTEKSFRNLIRCFGIDDELVKINMYANDVTYELQNNRRNVVVADKFVNFNNSDNTKATVYNYADPTNSNSVSYIDANSSLTGGFATTLETEVLFPLKISEYSPSYVNTNTISSSLFGVHGTTLSATKTTWPGDDTVNFQVYAVRDELYSDNVKFVLTSSTGGYIPKLSSSLYQQVYNNTRWNLAVRIKPETYPMKGLINSASSNYVVELHGIQAEAGVILEEFTVSASITAPRPSFVTGSKRVFVGAHRSNFTGSTVLDMTDVKVNACRYWLDYVDDEALRGHILDTENYGALQPHLYAFEFDTSASYGDVTKYDTLVFNWEFLTNTGSSAGGTFMVDDLSSGSADFTRFGSLGGILNKQYTASGSFFLPSSTKSIDKDFMISSKLNLPENVRAEDMVKVLNAQEQDVFTTESRPVNYYFAFEKSMYQVISEEILNSFANLKDFHNLIGDVVEQYRPEYKQLAFMRQKFFENVANQELDFEKFYEYYKWFDSSLSLMLGQLVPASADFSNNVRTMVENHVLERPKYRNKFPILQRKGGNDITGAVEGGGDGTAMGSPDDFPQGSLLFANTSLTKRQIGSSRTPQINSWKHFHAPIRETSLGPTKSLLFDESNDTNVTAGTAAQWQTDLADAYTNGVSVSFWFNISSFASGTEQVFNLGMINTGYPSYQGINMFLYDVGGTTPAVYAAAHTAGWAASENTNVRSSGLNLGTWYNVVVTIPAAAINGTGGDTPNMYINGGVDMPASAADSVVNWTTVDLGARGVTIGAKPAGSGLSINSFDGYMCDVAVWNKELTSVEVTEIYAFGERTNLSLASCVGNLLSWWKLGSGTGDTYNGAMSNEVTAGPSGTPNSFASAASIASVSPPAVSPYDPGAKHVLDMAWRNKNIYWQRYRSGSAEPKPTVASNTVRKDLLTAIKKSYDRSVNTPVKFGAEGYVTFGGVARPPNNKPNYTFAHCSPYGPMVSGSNVPINIMVGFNEGVEELIDSPDEYYPTFKQRLGFGMNPTINIDEVDSTTAFDGNLYAPFSMYSSSVETGYNATVVTTYKSGTMLTNLHNDFVDSHDTPAQGPFTEKFVGGRFFRHTEPNAGSDTRTTRAEGFRLELGTIAPGKAGALGVVPPNYPFSDTLESELTNDAGAVLGWLKDVPIAQRFRDETAKRPLNIKNILMTTASVGTRLSGTITHNPIGNYQKNYQVISTGGRMINDPFFQDQSFDFALNPETGVLRGRPPGQFQTLTNTKSMIFDQASNQYATIGAGSVWNDIIGNAAGTSKMTLSVWFNLDAEGSGTYQRFLSFGGYLWIDTHENDRWLRLWTYWNGVSARWYTADFVFTEGVWNHLVWTYDATSTANNPVVYLNGTSLSLTPGGTSPAGAWYGMPGVTDSSFAGVNGAGFGGSINEVTIWDSTLSSDQVTTLYTSQPTLPYNPALPTPAAWWRMGNGPNDTTSIIYDIAGTNNATPTNSPTFSNTVPTQTGLVNSELNFALPDRAGSNSNQTIIVNHFSAPGEYKTLSRGYLDPAHEELSAYNASPYRNRGVIDYGLSGSASADPSIAGSIRVVDQLGKNRGLNQLSTLHSAPFGVDSAYGSDTSTYWQSSSVDGIDNSYFDLFSYSITPSWTKTNRNPIIRFEQVTGSAGSFNGANSRVGIGTDAVWDSLIGGSGTDAKAFTLSAWVYAKSAGENNFGRIFSFAGSDRQLVYQAGEFRMYINGSISFGYTDSSSDLDFDKWYHVVATYSGGTAGDINMYVNGVLDTNVGVPVSAPLAISGYACYIGNDPTFAFTWDGYITDAAVWGRALTETEAQSLYNGGIVADLLDLSMYSVDTLRNNLIAWYRFDAALGDTTSNVVNRAPNPTAATDGDDNGSLVLQTQYAPVTAQKKRSYDNLYVQHAIPRNEQQYAWITASMAPYNGIYGLQRATCTSASTMSQLLTASTSYVDDDFVGLRSLVLDPVDLTTHTLGYTTYNPPNAGPWHYMTLPTTMTDAGLKLGSGADWNTLIGGAGAAAKAFTISMWVYGLDDDPGSGHSRLFEFGTASERRGAYVPSTLAMFRIKVSAGGSGGYSDLYSNSGTVEENDWTHVVFTYSGGDGGTMRIYINGQQNVTTTCGTPSAISGEQAALGNRDLGGSNPDRQFDGHIGTTAIWNRNLTAAEILALWNNGGRIELTNIASMRKNLLAWYRFDPNHGDTNVIVRNQAVWNVYGSDPNIPVAATVYPTAGGSVLTQSQPASRHNRPLGNSPGENIGDIYSNPYINTNHWWNAPTFEEDRDYFTALTLNRGGPYGNPTWKQIRGMDRPVVRKMRENNLIGVAIDPDSFINSVGTAQHPTRPNTFVDYYESPVENSKNPIYFYFEDNTTNSDSANNLIVTTPYGNELEHFSHAGLNTRLGLKVDLTQLGAYRSVKNFTMDSALSVLIKYSERIYPSTKNAYRKNIRGRTEYNIDNIWNNNREHRSIPLGGLSGAFVYSGSLDGGKAYTNIGVPTASIWPLDAHLNFATTGSALGTDGAGQLLNLYSRYSCSVVSDGTKRTNINAAPTYAYRTQYGWAASATGSGGQDPLYMGDAPWTAADTFGRPPYETYQSYADRIRSIGKDYSILPEFRISPLMSTYVNIHENNFLANVDNMFELTGAAVSSSVEDKFYTTYTNSDFLKYFKIVDDDLYEKRSGALKIVRDKVTLSCDALIKFLPYKGFYPAERTAELATIFSQSYGPSTTPAMTDYEANQNQVFRVVAEPLFSPGILHNTVKSGLAVSNFVLTYGGSGSNHTTNGPPMALTIPTVTTGAVKAVGGQQSANGLYAEVGMPTRDMLFAPQTPADGTLDDDYGQAGQYKIQTVPFEALYDPESFFNLATISSLSGSVARVNPAGTEVPNGVIYDTAPTGSLAYLNPGSKMQVGVDLATFRGSQTYKLAIDNFLSEVSTLFVDQFAHFKSDREENFKSVSSDNVYMMKLQVYRTKLPNSLTEAPDYENFTMYNNPLGFGQALIPDLPDTGWSVTSTAHVTPPYYGGPATVTFKYTPGSGVTVPTIDEVFANTTVTYHRESAYSPLGSNKRTYYSRMQISSSWNLFERLTEVPPGTVTQKSRWLLQSKMETPVLNFASTPMVQAQSASSAGFGVMVNIMTDGYGGATPGIRGMWHQYGSIPTGSNEGVFAVISPSPQLGSAVEAPTGGIPTGSLANILGFQAGVPLRIGSTTKEAKFEEAVVAVPYRVSSGVREFIKFPRLVPSLVTLRAAMDKYVFPPKFDFTRFDTVDAIMMYVFEFSADLTQADIANMWQNLPPTIGTEFKTQNAVVEEKELIDSIVSKDKDIEWMVFKVKKRARSDFELVRRSQVTNDLTSLQPRITTPYSYNWPYDYFSLVELAKITEGVDYISSDLKAGANISELESLDVDRSVISADFGAASYGAAYTGGGGSGGPQGAASNEVAQQSAARNNYGPGSSGKPPPQSTYPGSSAASSGKGAAQSVFNVASSGKGAAQSTYPGSSAASSGKGAAQSTYSSGQSTYSSGQSTVYTSTSGKGSGQASAGSSGISSRGASYGGATNYGSSYEGGGSQAPPPTQYPPPGSF